MRFFLLFTVILLSSNFLKREVQKEGIDASELCPNLGQIPKSQIPTRVIYKNRTLKEHVIILTANHQKLTVPLELVSNAQDVIQTEKDWIHFSKFYFDVCGKKPPFLSKKKFHQKEKQTTPSIPKIFSKKNSTPYIEGIGKVLYYKNKNLLLEGKVFYNQNPISSVTLEDGIFLVKNYNKTSPHLHSLLNLPLQYIGDYYDITLNLRVPIYKYLN